MPPLAYARAHMARMVDLIIRQRRDPPTFETIYETDMAEGLKAMALETRPGFLRRRVRCARSRRLAGWCGPAHQEWGELTMEVHPIASGPEVARHAKAAAQALVGTSCASRAPALTLDPAPGRQSVGPGMLRAFPDMQTAHDPGQTSMSSRDPPLYCAAPGSRRGLPLVKPGDFEHDQVTFEALLGASVLALGALASVDARACRQDAGHHQTARPAGWCAASTPACRLRLSRQPGATGRVWTLDVCKGHRRHRAGRCLQDQWVTLNAQQRFTALQSGEIDVLSRNTTWTLTRDALWACISPAPPHLMTAGGSWSPRSPITSAKQLKGVPRCACSPAPPPKPDRGLSPRPLAPNMKPVVFETQEATNRAYFAGRCRAYTTDASPGLGAKQKASNPMTASSSRSS